MPPVSGGHHAARIVTAVTFFKLTKSFRLLRFLNSTPSGPLRGIIASAGWLATLIFTRSGTLAREMWRRLYSERDLKLGFRRLAWYGRKSWIGVSLLADPVFDFTEGTDAAQRAAQRRFLARRERPLIEGRLDDLNLAAAEVDPPMHLDTWRARLSDFAAVANALLDDLSDVDAAPGPQRGKDRRGDFSVDDAAEALRAFAALFPVEEVPWYVISGTFLGIVREGGFLPHDYDIDLGLNAEVGGIERIEMLLRESPDFALVKMDHQRRLKVSDDRLEEVSQPILLKAVHRSGVHIDLFMHYLDGTIRWHGSNVHRWENEEFDLAPYRLAGLEVLGPADADRYLTENYGDWRIPRTKFNPSTGTPNLRMVHNLSALVLFLRRYALARMSGDPGSRTIRQVMLSDGYLKETAEGDRLSEERFL